MLHLYYDQAHTQPVPDNVGAVGTADVFQGNSSTGETTTPVQRWVWNDESATRRYEGIQLTALNDTADINIQYAPDNAGSPGGFVETLNLADGDYATPVPVWVQVVFAGGKTEPVTITTAKHRIIIAREYAK